MPENEHKPWMIREVPEYTRRKVKLFAVQHGMTVAEALELIVNQVVLLSRDEVMQDARADPTKPGN